MRRISEHRRIAVVGAGVSGLVAAAELHRAGHDVHVFEAGEYPGGHTNTIDVETPGGRLAVDTGFIVFNELNYPNFERMLAELGVASQPTDMSFSVSDGRGGFEWATTGPRGLFARPAHALDPRFHRMLRDLVRFNREARKLVGSGGRGPSLRRFLADGRYSDYFVERLLVPQASAVWSANPAQMWRFPASFLAQFFDNHRVLQLRDRPSWRSITGGSRRYVEALIAPFHERVNLRAPVRRVHRVPGGVVIALDDSCERFDEVVIAVHSDVALRMLADPAPAETDILGAIPYQRNEAVLHTDASLMPQRRSAWASWNYHLIDRPTGRTTVTYHMNRLQSLVADRDYLVTLNLTDAIDPATVIRSSTTRTRSLRRKGWPRSPAGPRSLASVASTTAAPIGGGGSTRTASGRPCGSREARWPRALPLPKRGVSDRLRGAAEPAMRSSRGPHERVRRIRGMGCASPSGESPTPSATGCSCRCSTSGSSPGSSMRFHSGRLAGRRRRASSRRLSRRRRFDLASTPGTWRSTSAAGRRGPSGCLRTRGISGSASTRSRSSSSIRRTAVEAVIAEVTNTPWGERTTYVLDWDGPEQWTDHRPLREGDARVAVSAHGTALRDLGDPAGPETRRCDPQSRGRPRGLRCFNGTTPLRGHPHANDAAAVPVSADDRRDARAYLRERAATQASRSPVSSPSGGER